MQLIFFGMFFVFLDFNLTIGNSIIGLIPDFVGYILMMEGLRGLSGRDVHFARALQWARGLMVYAAVIYLVDLLGVGVYFDGWLGLLLSITSSVVALICSYQIIRGIFGLEAKDGIDLHGERLQGAWIAMAICSFLPSLLFFIPFVLIIGILANFASSIAFLVFFWQTKERYLATAPRQQ